MKVILGIDEVGRGAWAGPLVVGAVILSKPINGIKDSKLLSKTNRYKYKKLIESSADYYALGWVTNNIIDEFGLTKAMQKAILESMEKLNIPYDEIIIDGNYNYLPDNKKARAIVNADESIHSVSAASILAKIARDEYMADQDKIYPNYGFSKNVGYGTRQHIASINKFGITLLHRKSFKPIKSLI